MGERETAFNARVAAVRQQRRPCFEGPRAPRLGRIRAAGSDLALSTRAPATRGALSRVDALDSVPGELLRPPRWRLLYVLDIRAADKGRIAAPWSTLDVIRTLPH